MSVSITLIPIALAMRAIMGKERFDAFVKNQTLNAPIAIQNHEELVEVLTKAGYDCVAFGNRFKTHYSGKNHYVLWENIDNQWQACFNKYDSQLLIDRFTRRLEKANNAPLLLFPSQKRATVQQEYETVFCDEQLLRETLAEFGAIPITTQDSGIHCKLEGYTLSFIKKENQQPFTLLLQDMPNADMRACLSELDDDYRRHTQTASYQKIKARAVEHNMSIQKEQVLDDKTIVLTLMINE